VLELEGEISSHEQVISAKKNKGELAPHHKPAGKQGKKKGRGTALEAGPLIGQFSNSSQRGVASPPEAKKFRVVEKRKEGARPRRSKTGNPKLAGLVGKGGFWGGPLLSRIRAKPRQKRKDQKILLEYRLQ